MSDIFGFDRGWDGRPTVRFTDFAGIDTSLRQPPAIPRNAFIAGISSGVDQMQGAAGAALAATGRLTGLEALDRIGTGIYQRNQQEAAASGRPDLEGVPWDENGPSTLPWLAYNVGRTIPYAAGVLGTGAVLSPFVPAGVAGAAGSFAARYVPQALGGGAGLSGVAAQQAGQRLANTFIGATVAGAPLATGSMYGEAIDRGDPTAGDAAKAFALSVPYAAAEAALPAVFARGLAQGYRKAGKAGAVAGVLKGMGLNAVMEAPTEAFQTALEQSFRDDLTPQQKQKNIVDAFLTGGAVGGVFGIGPGLRRAKTMNPNASNEEVQTYVDEALGLPGPQPMLALPPPSSGPTMYAGEDGRAASSLGGTEVGVDQRLGLPAPGSGPTLYGREIGGVSDDPFAQPQMIEGPEARLALPAPPPAPASISDLFVEVDTPTLMRLRARLEEDVAQLGNNAPPEVRRQLQYLRAEERRRADDAPATQTQQAPLFSELDFVQTDAQGNDLAEQRTAAAQAAANAPDAAAIARAEFLESVKARLGSRRPLPKWLQGVDAGDDVSLAFEVERRLDAGESSNVLMKLAESYGFIDAEGNERDIGREIANAEKLRDRLQLTQLRTGSTDPQMRAVDETLENLRTKQTIIANARALRAGPAQEIAPEQQALPVDQSAVYVAPTGEAQVSIPPGTPAPRGPSEGRQTLTAVQQNAAAQGANPLMQERVASARREMEFNAATAQREQQDQAVRDAGLVGARAQVAQSMPVRVDIAAAATGNPVTDPARAKTLAGFNGLTQEQQERVLASKLFEGTPDPQATLIETVRTTRNQRALRQQIAEAAGVEVDQFERTAPRQADESFFLRRQTSERTQAAVSSKAFDTMWSRVSKRLNGVARGGIVIADTTADLPEGVIAAAEAQGIPAEDIRGVMHQGKTYIVKSAVRSEADLQEAVFHEVLGHGGARKLFGADHSKVMGNIFDAAGGVEGLRKIARKFGVQGALDDYVNAAQERGMTDQDKAALADELLAQAAGVATGKWRTALMEWVGRMKAALVGFLRNNGMGALANRFDTFTAVDVAALLRDMRSAATGPAGANRADLEMTAFLRSPPEVNSAYQQATSVLDRAVKAFTGGNNLKTTLRPTALMWSSMGHIDAVWGKMLTMMSRDGNGRNGLREYRQAHQDRVTTANILGQVFDGVQFQIDRMLAEKPEAAKILNELMRLTELQINPRLSWDKHTHLHTSPNAQALKTRVEKGNAQLRRLSQMKYGQVYDALVQVNEMQNFAHMFTSLRNAIIANPVVAAAFPQSALVDAMVQFKSNEQVRIDPKLARDFWATKAEQLHNAAGQYLKNEESQIKVIETEEKANRATKKQSDQKEVIKNRISPLQIMFQRYIQSKAAMLRAPYFHIGRTGDYFVSFKIGEIKKRVADPQKMQIIANRLAEAGFTDVVLTQENPNSSVYIRVETDVQMNELANAVVALQDEGIVDPNTTVVRARRGTNQITGIERPQWIEKYIDALKAQFEPPPGASEQLAAAMKANQARVVAQAQELHLDSLSDTAIARVMAHRDNVHGSSNDMLRSYAWRYQLSTNALANMDAAQKINGAFTQMFARVREAQALLSKKAREDLKEKGIDPGEPIDIIALQDVVEEISTREAERPMTIGNTWVDKLRAVNHAYFLGFSPSYVAVNLTQPMVLLWPELARQQNVGFARAFANIASVTPAALRVVRAMMQEGLKGGVNRVPDAPITEAVLRNAGISKADQELLLAVSKRGYIDIGSFSRELARLAEGREDSTLDKTLRWAAAAGYYSETLSRVIAALAANKTYTGKPEGRDAYIDQVVNDTMLNYQSWYTARATGKAGVAGKLTPIAASFHTYSFQVGEKLYREMYDAIKGDTPESRAEARRFLGAHVAALTVLAGSLGLPFASVFARLAEKTVDMFGDDGDEPYDIKAAWRNFLADSFGAELGEIMARGLPRAAGFDISTRVGEQDLLPFSKFLTDRRKLEDAAKDFAFNTLGSPVSMVMNVAAGGSEILSGNMLEGMKKFVPVAIKGPTEAYRMTDQGYVDARGQVLPMEPGASDILWQALGFTPSSKAEYNEQRQILQARQGEMSRAASRLRKELVTAVEKGDRDAFSAALAQAREFDQKNPTFAVLPRLPGVLRTRAVERAQAEAVGTPLGVKLRDARAQEMTRFANY